MSAKIKILVEGYSNVDSIAETGEEKTQPTITLIRDENLVIVVDPGILESQQFLIDALEREGLTTKDVDIVCITHSHLDHYRNVGMFKDAKVLEFFGIWSGNTMEEWQEQFTENIQIIRTPGHDDTEITFFVKTEDGVIAICGDVFWKESYPKDVEDDIFASDFKKLKESRRIVLKMADWIIPGHGNIYKVEDHHKKEENESIISKFLKNTNFKSLSVCKKCHKELNDKNKCICRPLLCLNCCGCGIDCDLCGCDHKREY